MSIALQAQVNALEKRLEIAERTIDVLLTLPLGERPIKVLNEFRVVPDRKTLGLPRKTKSA